MQKEISTRDKVLYFSKQEFLQRGFINASLRNIATSAGMTTGAIYTYFKDKNALFEAIVDPVCNQIENILAQLSESYYKNDEIVSFIDTHKSLEDLYTIYEYIYKNFDIFRLLVVGAEGSSKSGFIHTIVDLEVKHTLAYLEVFSKKKKRDYKINVSTIHAISESYINSLLEPVRHNMSYEEAVDNIDLLVTFYTGGWQSFIKKLFP